MNISRLSTLVVLILVTMASSAAGEEESSASLYQRIDSLFVIASSGELKYRDKVEPAIDAIADLGAPAVPHLIDKFTTRSARERLTVINILKKIGSPAVPDLLSALERPEWLVVKRVCWALGDIKDTAATVALINVSNHSSWQVREYCIGALGKIGDERGIQTVLAAFEDSVGQVRKAAVFAAGEIKSVEAIGALIHALNDDFYGARLSAVEALLVQDSVAVVYQIRDSLPFASPLSGRLACRVLGRIGSDTALFMLSRQLDSKVPALRTSAAVAIVSADPMDKHAYHSKIFQTVTDRLALLQIHSALAASKDDSP